MKKEINIQIAGMAYRTCVVIFCIGILSLIGWCTVYFTNISVSCNNPLIFNFFVCLIIGVFTSFIGCYFLGFVSILLWDNAIRPVFSYITGKDYNGYTSDVDEYEM